MWLSVWRRVHACVGGCSVREREGVQGPGAATEALTVVDGELYVGFVATDGKLFAKVLSGGDVFVFPKGLVHFEFNRGPCPAVAIAGLSSQNPGLIRVADGLFGASPNVSDEVLAKAFRIDTATARMIKAQFGTKS
ncbi:hypothetical protein EJB05_24477, partial [Eragrostis curvula]